MAAVRLRVHQMKIVLRKTDESLFYEGKGGVL